jgi:hypothetical protein
MDDVLSGQRFGRRMREREAAAELQRRTGFAGQYRRQANPTEVYEEMPVPSRPAAVGYGTRGGVTVVPGGRDLNREAYNAARRGGYSPEFANIAAESLVGGDASKLNAAPRPWKPEEMAQELNPGIRYAGPAEGKTSVLGGVAGADYGGSLAEVNRAGLAGARDAMRMTDELRGRAGQRMTIEAKDRFVADVDARNEREEMRNISTREAGLDRDAAAELERIKAEAVGNVRITELDDGTKVISGNGQPQVIRPQAAAGAVQPAVDPQGNVLGNWVTSPTGEPRFVPEKQETKTSGDPYAEEARRKRRQEILEELGTHQRKVAEGDRRHGFVNMFSREERIKELQNEMRAMDASGSGSVAPAAQAAPQAASQAAPAAAPVYGKHKTTGERMVSMDGGKTWSKAQ